MLKLFKNHFQASYLVQLRRLHSNSSIFTPVYIFFIYLFLEFIFRIYLFLEFLFRIYLFLEFLFRIYF